MFFENAYKGNNEFWAYLVTIVAIFFSQLIGGIPLFILMLSVGGSDPEAMQEFTTTMDFESLGIDSNVGFAVILLAFVITFFTLWLMLRWVHKRDLKSLITPFEKINWSKIGFGFGLWLLFSVVLEAASYIADPSLYVFQFEPAKFIPLMIIALVMLPIQTSTEELVFRGYLLQWIGTSTKSKALAIVITSVAFGMMHLANPEIEEFGTGIMMTYYIGMGLFLAVLTVMDDSLELALGIHAANNIFGATLVTFDGSALQTASLFKTTEVNIDLMLPVFIVITVIFTGICAWKYGWKDWSKLIGTVEEPPPPAENEWGERTLDV